jgi:hypothetical protein
VKFLKDDSNPLLQFEACWALTNVASGSSNQCRTVVNSGALQIFIRLLNSPNEDVFEQSSWAIGNIAGDSTILRDLCLRLNVLNVMIEVGNLFNLNTKISIVRNFCWSLSNLCRGKPQPHFELISTALPLLYKYMHMFKHDTESLIDICWACSYISDGDSVRIEGVIRSNIVPKLIECLDKENRILTPALRTIGNLLTGTDGQTQSLINLNVVPVLLRTLDKFNDNIKKETAWALSNIAAGNSDQIQVLLDGFIFEKLVLMLDNRQSNAVTKDIIWTIANAFSGSTNVQRTYLSNLNGIIRNLLIYLEIMSMENEIVALIVDSLKIILENSVEENTIAAMITVFDEFNYVEKLELVQGNDNIYICDQILSIVEDNYANPVQVDPIQEEANDASTEECAAGAGTDSCS